MSGWAVASFRLLIFVVIYNQIRISSGLRLSVAFLVDNILRIISIANSGTRLDGKR
jgi:hypothetical protein